MVHDLGIADIVHSAKLLDRFLVSYSNELLLQGARPERAVEVEDTGLWIRADEGSHVFEIGESSTKSYDANRVSSLLDLANCSADNALQNRPSVVMKQMNLVYNDQAHEICIAGVGSFASDDIVLFRRRDDDLRLRDLLLGELTVTSKLCNLDIVWCEPLPKIANLLLYESFQGRNVYDLKVVEVNFSRFWVAILADLAKHSKHGNVGLARARRSADQHILVAVKGCGIAFGLYSIESRCRTEAGACPRRQFRRRQRRLFVYLSVLLWRWNLDLFVAFERLAGSTLRQIELCVRHQMVPSVEHQVLEIDCFLRFKAARSDMLILSLRFDCGHVDIHEIKLHSRLLRGRFAI